MKRSALIPVLILSGVCMISGCKAKNREKIDLSSLHTTAATEASKETLAATIAPTTEPETTAPPAVNVTAAIETYESTSADKRTIQYPVVSNMSDPVLQESVNKLLKENATIFETYLEAFDTNVTAEIKCKVVSIDRKRLTAVYTGSYLVNQAPHPTNVFYTNTVDLTEAKSLGFDDYSDSYTMAGYVMSDDCEFSDASGDLKQELLNYRATQSLETYHELFRRADFPLEEGAATFPESFSYVDQSILYFSIPVPHALGDYALIQFKLDGK